MSRTTRGRNTAANPLVKVVLLRIRDVSTSATQERRPINDGGRDGASAMSKQDFVGSCTRLSRNSVRHFGGKTLLVRKLGREILQ